MQQVTRFVVGVAGVHHHAATLCQVAAHLGRPFDHARRESAHCTDKGIVTRRAAHERDVSMVFQSYALFPHLNVLDNVCYGPIASGAKPASGLGGACE